MLVMYLLEKSELAGSEVLVLVCHYDQRRGFQGGSRFEQSKEVIGQLVD
jgi:hypothetical protein